jgi:hypothetical protein
MWLMHYRSKSDKQKEARDAHQVRQERLESHVGSARRKKRNWLIAITFILLSMGSYVGYATFSAGPYDDFAKCLTEKGVVMQGEDWCQFTNAQKAMFGNSFEYITYEVNPDLKLRPTWIIDGNKYETVQSFDTLAQLSGCTY